MRDRVAHFGKNDLFIECQWNSDFKLFIDWRYCIYVHTYIESHIIGSIKL